MLTFLKKASKSHGAEENGKSKGGITSLSETSSAHKTQPCYINIQNHQEEDVSYKTAFWRNMNN